MQFICSKKNPTLPLTDYLSAGDPLIISVESFVGYLKIHLQAIEGQNFRITGSKLPDQHAAFSTPFYGNSFNSIPSGTFFVITHDQFGYTILFCLSYLDLDSSLVADEEGLHLVLDSGTSSDAKLTRTPLICLRGDNLQDLLRDTMKLALEITGFNGRLYDEKNRMPEWLSYFGWSSGLMLGDQISHDKIIDSIKSLVSQGVILKFVLIEEGWQQLALNGKGEDRKWAMLDFEADKEKFPRGLKGLVVDLNALGIYNIGVWHGIMGARGGIHPLLARQYDLLADRFGRYHLGNDLGRTFKFYYDYYAFLKKQGITFVKVGDQNAVPFFEKPNHNCTTIYKNLQAAIQAAANIQFNQPIFNTECLRNENLFYWSTSTLVRSSDAIDWKHAIGFIRSLRNHLTNSLWLQYLTRIDVGCWITHGPLSEHVAIFQALSGSSQLLGDLPGKFNKRYLQKMTLSTGEILKPDSSLNLCYQSLFSDPILDLKIYKAYTFKRGCGILVAFNIINDKEDTIETISSRDIPNIKGDQFALFSYRHGFLGLVDKDQTLPISLKANQTDIFTFAPVNKGVAIYGCLNFYLSLAPITKVQIEEDSVNISCVEGTPLMIYCDREILEVRRNGEVIPWEHDFRLRTLKIDSKLLKTPNPCDYVISFES